MTDAEIVAQWMEPRPKAGPWDKRPWRSLSPGSWWKASESRAADAPNEWYPNHISLDVLHGVEKRLTDELWERYRREICLLIWNSVDGGHGTANLSMSHGELLKKALHAPADQKLAALAAVLRPEVERG